MAPQVRKLSYMSPIRDQFHQITICVHLLCVRAPIVIKCDMYRELPIVTLLCCVHYVHV